MECSLRVTPTPTTYHVVIVRDNEAWVTGKEHVAKLLLVLRLQSASRCNAVSSPFLCACFPPIGRGKKNKDVVVGGV